MQHSVNSQGCNEALSLLKWQHIQHFYAKLDNDTQRSDISGILRNCSNSLQVKFGEVWGECNVLGSPDDYICATRSIIFIIPHYFLKQRSVNKSQPPIALIHIIITASPIIRKPASSVSLLNTWGLKSGGNSIGLRCPHLFPPRNPIL